MKRFALISLLAFGIGALCSTETNAQSKPNGYIERSTAAQTLTNAQSVTTLIDVRTPAQTVAIQAEITKGTGTTTGKIIAEVSNTGTSWIRLGTAPGITFPADSLVFTNITGSVAKIYTMTDLPYKFVRLTTTTTGTQVTTVKSLSIFKSY